MTDTTAEGTGVATQENAIISNTAHATGEVFTALLALRGSAPVWLADVFMRINRLTTLPHNWDSYGALEINDVSMILARNAISVLSRFDTIEAPIVTASPNGSVVFSWDDGERSLDLEVRPDEYFEFAYDSNSYSCMGVTRDLDDIAYLLTRF